jgi:hypothetical protein
VTTDGRYQTPSALWAAARDHARSSGDTSTALREFVYDRLLARLFTHPDPPWVLKGGNALVSRSPHAARATTDIDLGALNQTHNLADLEQAFTEALNTELGDYFRFTIATTRPHPPTQSQPHITGTTITVQAWCGTRRTHIFRVDLVTGSLITGQPDITTRVTAINLDGIAPAWVVLYPIVDHIADKVCATAQLYSGTRSSRERDLVDLVVIATTQHFTAHQLKQAVDREWDHRQLPGKPHFDPPTAWAARYTDIAKRTPGCANHTTFAEALSLVRNQMLQPVWDGHAKTDWSPIELAWTTNR